MTPDVPDAKIVIPLTQDDAGWPPAATESMWATSLGGDRYRIANVPFFAPNLAVNDIVRARTTGVPSDAGPDATATPTFLEILEPSEHVTLRLIVHPPTSLEDAVDVL